MPGLHEYLSYEDAQRAFAPARLWELFDGDRARLNIAHECIDRHAADPARVAIWVAFADGHDEQLTFRAISELSARFAHWLTARGIGKGERVAIMLEPSLIFYAALFGAMRAGAIAVPLFTLFGPDGVRLRIEDCAPRLLLTNAEKAREMGDAPGVPLVIADDVLMRALAAYPEIFEPRTAADDLAIYQYTSGTSGSAAHPPRDHYAHGCGTVRHRDPAWRSVFLPIIACLGARLVARHPGAACARRTDRHVLWEIRR